MKTRDACSHQGCDREIVAKSLCGTHYAQMKRHGRTQDIRPPRGLCTATDCGKPHDAKGYCKTHRARVDRTGDPHLTHVANKKKPCTAPGCDFLRRCGLYCAKHEQRVRMAGSPAPSVHRLMRIDENARTGVCEMCGETSINPRPTSSVGWQCGTAYADRQRRYHLQRHFNLTSEQYDEMLQAQGGGCSLCGRCDRRMHIDHDHSCCPRSKSCGKCVRSILCADCNTGLGQFKDDPALLRRAAAYLEHHQGGTT